MWWGRRKKSRNFKHGIVLQWREHRCPSKHWGLWPKLEKTMWRSCVMKRGMQTRKTTLIFGKSYIKGAILLICLFDHHARTGNLLIALVFSGTPWVYLSHNNSEYENWWPNTMYIDAKEPLQNLSGYLSYYESDCFLFLQFKNIQRETDIWII